jgi:hypothetical protein
MEPTGKIAGTAPGFLQWKTDVDPLDPALETALCNSG